MVPNEPVPGIVNMKIYISGSLCNITLDVKSNDTI